MLEQGLIPDKRCLALAMLVGKAKCRVFGWEDAANEPQRNVLAVLIEGFDQITPMPPSSLTRSRRSSRADSSKSVTMGDRIRRARSPKSASRCLTSRMPPRKHLHPASRCTSSTGSSSRQLAGNRGLGVGAQMPMHLQNSYSRAICLCSPTRSGQMSKQSCKLANKGLS